MRILDSSVNVDELKKIASDIFGDLVKAVVDVERGLVAIDAELHSDLEAMLLEDGSQQENLWGINFYTDFEDDNFVEFDSMINLRPSKGNMSRGIDSEDIQKAVINIVNKWVQR